MLKRRTVQVRPKSTSAATTFTDSLTYLSKPIIDYSKHPFPKHVIDYSTTTTGYTAIIYEVGLQKRKGKTIVNVIDTEIFTNEQNLKYFKSEDFCQRTIYMRFGNFLDKIIQMDTIVLIKNTPKNEYLHTLVRFPKLHLHSEINLKQGRDAGVFPKKLIPEELTQDSYFEARSKIFEHLHLKFPNWGGAIFYTSVEIKMDTFNFKKIQAYLQKLDSYHHRRELAMLCDNFGFKLKN
ncbi:DhNV_084 [Dikerogammarus haemobaphes nudivirus]|nr:DhNV_084 [Dikerogammarus haemobaphes nudivirus]